jgi:hypothetical protein
VVPVGVGESVCLGPGKVQDGGAGRGNDDLFDRGGVVFDGLEETDSAVDGRVQEIFLEIRNIEAEWAGGVNDSLEGGVRNNGLVEGYN